MKESIYFDEGTFYVMNTFTDFRRTNHDIGSKCDIFCSAYQCHVILFN